MDNHIHLILVPSTTEALRATLASVHTRYSQRINRIKGTSGHVFQGRYASFPMDDAYLMAAIRYVENNPVDAGLVKTASDWKWSSARSHLGLAQDRLTDIAALAQHVPNWRAMLEQGLEAAGWNETIERAMRSGQPLGTGTVPSRTVP